MKPIVFLLFFSLIVLTVSSSFGQGVRVSPDGEVSKQTLSLPYVFYNESFGFAAGYVHGVVGLPQKQATLLATVMAGSKGSAMGERYCGPHRYRRIRRRLQGADDDSTAVPVLGAKQGYNSQAGK